MDLREGEVVLLLILVRDLRLGVVDRPMRVDFFSSSILSSFSESGASRELRRKGILGGSIAVLPSGLLEMEDMPE